MKPSSPAPGGRALAVEGWIALVLLGFVVVRIAGSATAHRIVHSFLGR